MKNDAKYHQLIKKAEERFMILYVLLMNINNMNWRNK